MEQTKPNEATGLKLLVIINLCPKGMERSHCDEVVAKSVGYGGFRPVFCQGSTESPVFYIADLGLGGEGYALRMRCDLLGARSS